ncbi:phosphate system positive regulatory protein pho81 [Coemansia javaensis]|uniref:Phosphate system positive regulatory protein pho81 n=1 Tax=Coemansia javaensis TaxID=2761396 RepID=A0A9W8HD87_9FUNG|nr:phosphate system positive regulatory protein pho81 [Coemansia javaensis]
MKFGKHIQAQTIPEWAVHYMSYKGLKKIINELSTPLAPGAGRSEAAKERLQAVKAAFFFQVDRELEKVNAFYVQKEADFKVRLKSLIEKQRAVDARGPRNHTATVRALREAFLNSRHDLDKLQNFVEINGTGFRKILKKWDKRSKSSTKELYLARQVEVQPCFNQEVIAELSDTVTRCLSDLEHALDEGAERIPPAALPRDVAAELQREGSGGSSEGLLLDHGVARSVQIDRAEAELFQALAAGTAEALVARFAAERTEVQQASVTRVLWRACAELRDAAKQRLLLASGLADMRSVDDINDRTLAHEAAMHGALDVLRAAVAGGCSADAPDYYSRRPVHYAAINNYGECLDFLLRQGCSARALDDDGNDAFAYAVGGGHVACARRLLDHDAAVVRSAPGRAPPLALACERGHDELVRMLLAAGAELEPNTQGLHPLHVAARGGFAAILRALLAHGAPADVPDKDLGWTPVFYAASEGNAECIRVLLDAGCSAAAVDENGRGPAYFAASEGHLACVDMLLAAATARAAGAAADPDASASASATTAANAAAPPADLDGIPSLSLPPPLIPFRVYGHNFLGKRTRIHIRMLADSRTGASPVTFVDARDMVSLRLVAVARPDAGMVPHTVMLPMDTSSTTFGFQTDCLDRFRLEFQLFPSFGLQPIGKAVALPSLFAGSSGGLARLPLLDRYLKLVAEISFEFLVIRPFEGAQLQIGGKVETYWKSTNPQAAAAPTATAAAAVPGLGSSPARPLLSSSGISSVSFASPTSVADSAMGGSGYGSVPVVISSSLAAEHVCVQVQVCRDGVPVVSPRMYIDIGSPSGVELRIHSLTHAEFRSVMCCGSGPTAAAAAPSAQSGTAADWHQYLRDGGFSLEEVLELLPPRFGIGIHVLDNSLAWSGTNSKIGSARHDMNNYIDAILKTVYQDSLKGVSSGGQARREGPQRNTVFCSYSPTVCVSLNWKQPNYAVFLLTSGREPAEAGPAGPEEAPSFGPPSRHLSVKEAVRFACTNNMLGVMCRSSLLARVPALIDAIKSSGLVAISFGPENRDPALCAALKEHGVDAIMCDGVIAYEMPESLDYAI